MLSQKVEERENTGDASVPQTCNGKQALLHNISFLSIKPPCPFQNTGDAEVPHTRTYHGKQGVFDYFGRLDSYIKITGFEVEEIVGEGPTVIGKVRGPSLVAQTFGEAGAQVRCAQVRVMY